MPQSINHDAIFKHAFSQPEAAAALVQPSLSPVLSDRIAWDELRPVSGEAQHDDSGELRMDAVFWAPLRAQEGTQQEALIHLHLEHQSQNDASMILRTLSYASALLFNHHRSQTPQPDPPVPPLIIQFVISHDPRGWRAATSLRELYPGDAELTQASYDHQIHHRYSVVDLAKLNPHQLRARASSPWAALILFALRESRKFNFLRRIRTIPDIVNAVAQMPDGTRRFHRFTCYVLTVTPDKSLTGKAINQELAAAGTQANEASKTAWEIMQEEMTAEARQEAHQEGREEGREEGRQETLDSERDRNAQLLASMLTERFGALTPAQSKRINTATIDQLHDWIRNSISCESIDTLLN